jgi:ParB family chromosome partitioning protein
MKIRIDEIVIADNKRIRKESGDLSHLMKSLTRFGQLQPVVLDPEFRLICGYRRISAARKLGWTVVDAKIVEFSDKLSKLDIEIEENTVRKNLTFDEIDAGIKKREKFSRFSIFSAARHFFKNLFS